MAKKQGKRTQTACDQCRRRKAKCDGRSLCGACQHLGLHCSYGDRAKLLRGPAYIALLENKVEQLQLQLGRHQSSNADLSQLGDDIGYLADLPIRSECVDEAGLGDSGMGASTGPCVSDISPCLVELSAARVIPHGDDIDLEGCSDEINVNDSSPDSFALDAPPEVLSTMACGDFDHNVQTATSTDVAGTWYQNSSLSDHAIGQRLNLDMPVTWPRADMPNLSPPLNMSSDPPHLVPLTDFIPAVEQQIGPFHETFLKHLVENQQAEGEATATPEKTIMTPPHFETPEILQVPPFEQSELKGKDLALRHGDDDQVPSPVDDGYDVCGEVQPHHRRSRSAEARERNRLAAAKCRGKKNIAMTQLAKTAREMGSLNRSLKEDVRHLRNERVRLQELALEQKFRDGGTRDPV